MDDIGELSSPGERLSFFKIFSEKKFKVEIPIIQRDYAQGRPSVHEVRESFLEALYAYLEQGKPNRDLDFVYGSLYGEGDSYRFVPLDGQQRLTTLFLLHWYLAQLSSQTEVLRSVLYKNNKSLFSYETRTSSSEFCDALMAFDLNMENLLEADFGKNNRLSKTIQDKGWFYLSWTHDPTIQSMLTMLDSIHTKFSTNPEFFQKLIDKERPVITFLFLNLHAFNLTDDLYIKMNARGKPLTAFENFKAKFEQRIKSFRDELPRYELIFSDNLVDGYEYFIHKIDTDWADIFWAYRNVLTEDETFDDELMCFISLVIANYKLLEKSKKSGRQPTNIDKFFLMGGRVRRLSFQEYSELGCLSPGLIEHLILMMDLLHHKGLKDGKLKSYIENNSYFSEDEVFKKVITNNTSYPEKLRFYAFYIYLARWKADAEMMEWLRVVYNLTENTIINTAEDYRRTLLSIDELSKNKSILDALKRGCDVSAFSGAQVLEEKVKAHLITKSEEWGELVVNAEQHPFFRGQIGFALSFSGILDFHRENGCCEWDVSQDKTYLKAFKKYANSGANLFSVIKDSSAVIHYLWERAVLSKGVYFTEASADRWNMLSTRLSKNNIERDHSWKRLLRISPTAEVQWVQRQSYVKAVFDDAHFDVNNIQDSLMLICNEALENDSINGWEKAFIKYPALFSECHQGFIVRNINEIILLNESQRNHYHSELNTRVLELELNLEHIQPFKQLRYISVRSRGESPHLVLVGWRYNEGNYQIDIRYSSNEYELRFYASEPQNYSDDLIRVLEANKLKHSNKYQDTSYLYKCKTSKEIFDVLRDITSGLQVET